MDSTPHAPARGQTRHITPRTYLIVFGWLTLLTALEVLIASAVHDESIKVPILIVIAVVKALLVVLFYMHLRYDSKIYWLFLVVPVGFVLLLSRYLMQQ